MARPTVIQILELAESTKADEAFRPVLHDALLERYGSQYEDVLARAADEAARYRRPIIVVLSPNRLGEMEMKSTDVRRTALLSWGALYPALTVASPNHVAVCVVEPLTRGRTERRAPRRSRG